MALHRTAGCQYEKLRLPRKRSCSPRDRRTFVAIVELGQTGVNVLAVSQGRSGGILVARHSTVDSWIEYVSPSCFGESSSDNAGSDKPLRDITRFIPRSPE
jgi:hypothetical protein